MAAVFNILALSGGPVDIAEVWVPEESTLYAEERQRLLSGSSKSTGKWGTVAVTSPATNSDLTQDSRQYTKSTAIKNIIGVAISFGGFSLAFFCVQGLQSSINSSHGLGLISLSIMYMCLIISCFYSPVVVRVLGTKRTLMVSYTLATVYTITNAFPSWYTLIPSTVIFGLFYGPLWTSVNVHMTTVSIRYSATLKKNSDSLVMASAGILYFFISVGEILGDLATSIILFNSYADGNKTEPELNITVADYISAASLATNTSHELCNNHEADNIKPMYMYLLMGFFAVVNVATIVLVMFCINQLHESHVRGSSTTLFTMYFKSPLLKMFKTSMQYKMCLLLPTFFYAGMECAFLFGQYTKTFTSDCIGVHWIGFVSATFSVMTASASLTAGKLAKIVPTYILIAAAVVIQGGVVFFLLFWERSPNFAIVFAMAGVWGLGDGIFSTQAIGITGILFPDSQEAAFSIMRVWRSIGYLFGFLSANFLSVHVQLWTMIGQLALTFVTNMVLALVVASTNRKDKKAFAAEKIPEDPAREESLGGASHKFS